MTMMILMRIGTRIFMTITYDNIMPINHALRHHRIRAQDDEEEEGDDDTGSLFLS